MTPADFDLAGRTFRFPPALWGMHDGSGSGRVIGGILTRCVVSAHGDRLIYDTRPGSVDLSFVRTGRLPLLLEHCRVVENLLGSVTSVVPMPDGAALQFQARLARTPWADRVWELMSGGFPLSISIGAKVLAVEESAPEAGSRTYVVTRWCLDEVSVVVHGADEAAHAVIPKPVEFQLSQMEIRARALAGNVDALIRHRLHLDRWSGWPDAAAAGLAAELGVDQERARASLQAAVDAQIAGIVADLSGSAGAPTAPLPLELAAA